MSRERERTSSMVASYSSAPPTSWRPTARTLGALFAGSAVMFASTVVNGYSLLRAGNEAGSITPPLAGPSPGGPATAPGEFTPGTPDAARGSSSMGGSSMGGSAQWSSSVGDLPVWRAPVQHAPPQGAPAAAASAETASEEPVASGDSVKRTPAPDQASGNAGFGRPASQTADSRQGGPFDGLLNSVLRIAKGALT